MLFPPGIFYIALLSLDSSILNQLCYIMHRYRNNLTAAKKNELILKKKSEFIFSSKTCQEYNRYLTAMVGCLWTSKPFQKGSYFDPEVFKIIGIAKYKTSLNLVHHPALLSYAISFLLKEYPEERRVNVSSIRGKKWNEYLDYLFSEGLQGLKLFIRSSIRHSSVPWSHSINSMINMKWMLTEQTKHTGPNSFLVAREAKWLTLSFHILFTNTLSSSGSAWIGLWLWLRRALMWLALFFGV